MQPANHTAPTHAKSVPPKKLRLLLVEDDLDLAEVLTDVIEWHNYKVVTAHHGVDGLKAVMAEDFDAIICDLIMSPMSGDMFFVGVGKLKPWLLQRFVFITGAADSPEVARFLWSTRQPYLCKPLETDLLMNAVDYVIHSQPPKAPGNPVAGAQAPVAKAPSPASHL